MKIEKTKIFGILGLSLIALTACETVPYADRVAAYEAKMNSDFVGKSVDNLIFALGPPQSSYPLTDGRDVIQYSFEESETRGGGTHMDYETIVIGYRTHTRQDGSTKQVPITKQIPYMRTDPVYTVHKNCIKRFTVTKEKLVEGFKWEGNSCF